MIESSTPPPKSPGERGIAHRVFATLELVERRGYSLKIESLAECLVGGSVSVERLRRVIGRTPGLKISDGLVHTDTFDLNCVRRTLDRQSTHAQASRPWGEAVEEFVEMLVRRCPQLRCVALAGSMSAGGFAPTDDIDFNLFVEDGKRYTTYLQANLLALKFARRYRDRPTDAHTRRPFLPKLMSVNVIWTDGQVRPFERQDGPMALELYLSRPLWGGEYFEGVLGCNRWLDDYFPQFRASIFACARPEARQPRSWEDFCERVSYVATYLGWRWVMWNRRHNPEALARVARVRKYQSPYALFERGR